MDLTELSRWAVETSPDGLWVIDLQGRTLYANPEIGRIHRIPAEQLASLTVFDTLDDAGKQQFAEHLEAVGRGELNTSQVEVQWVRDDGTVVWMLVSETALLDDQGRATALMHRFTDYTERRAMVESLRASEEALADQVAQNTLVQAVTSAANQASTLLDVLVHARDLVLLHDDWERARAFVPDDDGEVVPFYASPEAAAEDDDDPFAAVELDLARRCLRTRAVVWDERHLTVVFPVSLRERVVAVLAVTSAPPLWRFELIEDIALRLADQLARVAEREEAQVELARARDQAMEASRQKSEFLATMSHEIRTPINGVIGLNDLLLRSDLGEEQRRLATGVQVASRALLDVVNDILDFSKIEAGRLVLEQVAFEVRPVLDQVIGLLAETARVKGVQLTVTCDAGVPGALTGDPTRLGQVLTNLISNAVKFTEVGRVEVAAWVAPGADQDVVLNLEVRDTGVGVPEDRVAVLFEPFTQADTSTTRRYGGTGLGLAICREIVAAMGGRLGYLPNPGGGSVFGVAVPMSPAQVADAVRTTARPASPSDGDESARQALGGRRVLVVDDGGDQTALTDQLGWWGVLVETSGSIRAAVARLDADGVAPVDVVVMAMAGVEQRTADLLGRLRDAGHTPPPMLVITSTAHPHDEPVHEHGIDEVLVRPVLPGAFRAALVRLVTGGAVRPRILVVEDHPVNQMVAAGLLEALGYDSEIAEDGEAGVERARRGGLDAVLMDVQMPRLDGYEATRRIRRDHGDHSRIPIIAMTAAAIEGERERCLAAGMDDFLTKPVDSTELRACLDRWVHHRADARTPPTPPDVQGGDPAPDALDLTRLAELRELDTDAASYVDRAVGNFLAKSEVDTQVMRAALAESDLDQLRSVAHRLAGSALNLGAADAGEALRAIENAVRADAGADLAALLGEAETELATARHALRDYLGEHRAVAS